MNWRTRVFQASGWVLVASLYFLSPAILIVLGWFQEPFSELGNAETVSHRVHEVLFGALFGSAIVGASAQLVRKSHRAGALQAVVTVGTFFVVLAGLRRLEGLAFLFLGLALIVLVSNPSEGAWFRPHWGSLLLAGAGVLPLFLLTVEHIAKAQVQAADHVTHWGGVAAWSASIAVLAIIAGLRPSGYRLIEITIAINGLVFVGVSIAYQFDASARANPAGIWLAVWSVCWLIKGLRPHRERESRWWKTAFQLGGYGTVAFLGLVGSVGYAGNVPHGVEAVSYDDLDRATCLDCHAIGREGATIVPHDVTRSCESDCWGGRSDCLGCHRYDPALGGPTLTFVFPAEARLPDRAQSLRPSQLVSIRDG
ncbi:MAG: hypothetical protein ABR609_15735 [Acidimicrobiia bacterium]